MLDVVIFNVEHGQSIFFYPHGAPDYGMLVDCGNTPEFDPIDSLIKWGLLKQSGSSGRYVLSNLTLTNYDQDHFSGLPYLRQKADISTIRFAKNLSTSELRLLKSQVTDALQHICHLKDTYTYDAPHHAPPYLVATFSLPSHCFPDGQCTTNNLSQIVFVEYAGTVVCISGDVEELGWLQHLQNPQLVAWLNKTNIFVAAHHGRENGHAEEVFGHCWPECVLISDKEMMHGTQVGMAQAYANHVLGSGVKLFSSSSQTSALRKVLTTRSDGHLWVRILENGAREYRNFA